MQQATLFALSSPSVSLVNNRPATTSFEVAKFFDKRHDNVVRDIRQIMDNCPESFRALNFEETFRTVDGPNGATREEVYFILYRDGFMLLAMGYTGKKAMQIKIAYIEAFNAMEAELLKQTARPAIEDEATRTRRLARDLKRRQRERESENPQKALPAVPESIAAHAIKAQAAMDEVKTLCSEFIAAVFRLQSAIRRPVRTDNCVSTLTMSLERNLPVFGTAIGMNVSALSELLDVYASTLSKTSGSHHI